MEQDVAGTLADSVPQTVDLRPQGPKKDVSPEIVIEGEAPSVIVEGRVSGS